MSFSSLRQRDVFPLLIPFDNCRSVPVSISRQVKRRILRKRRWQDWCCEGVYTLNAFSGQPQKSNLIGLGDIHHAALDNIIQNYSSLELPPIELDSQTALGELIGTTAGYEQESSNCTVRPYDETLVSWSTWAQHLFLWCLGSHRLTLIYCRVGKL